MSKVIHFEVTGKDGNALMGFYGGLFGWEFDTDNPIGYGLIAEQEGGIGGGVGQTQDGSAGAVTFYVATPDIEASLAKATEFGGNARNGRRRRCHHCAVRRSGRPCRRTEQGLEAVARIGGTSPFQEGVLAPGALRHGSVPTWGHAGEPTSRQMEVRPTGVGRVVVDSQFCHG